MIAIEGPNFLQRSAVIGAAFENKCNALLISLGFILLGREHISDPCIEISQVAKNLSGEKIYFEFVGGCSGEGPGLMRTDTTKKVLCNAFLLRECGLTPFVVIASVKPVEGSISGKMILKAGDAVFDILSPNDPDDRIKLIEILNADNFAKRGGETEIKSVNLSTLGASHPLSNKVNHKPEAVGHTNLKLQQSMTRKLRIKWDPKK